MVRGMELFRFDPVRMFKCISYSLDCIAGQKLLVDVRIKDRGERLNEKELGIHKGQVTFMGMLWRSIKVGDSTFYLSDDDFDSAFSQKVWQVYNSLSKNKQKKYAEVERALLEKMTYKRMENYFNFIQEHMDTFISTQYGFDGYKITIERVYPYDITGKKKKELMDRLRAHEVKRKKLMNELYWLDREDDRIKSEIRELKEGD